MNNETLTEKAREMEQGSVNFKKITENAVREFKKEVSQKIHELEQQKINKLKEQLNQYK